MRRGELVGPHWSDVDLERGVLQVRYTVSRVAGLGLIVGEPKSKAGRRKIMLSPVVIEALKKHRVKQEQARIEAAKQWKEQGLVFCNMYGVYFDSYHVWYLFKRLLKTAG